MKKFCLLLILSAAFLPAFKSSDSKSLNSDNFSKFARKQEKLKSTSASDTALVIDGRHSGLIFDGVGSISAGASSRLLYDYPENERNQILDYLFKPNYGAALQILKVEIGSDMNSTDGSEASHMRTPDDLNCERGYEWWLMKEAKKRNPDIKLYALAWGAPAWVENFWSKKNIDYLMAWLDCAKSKGFTIDYVGGWNEKGYDTNWYIAFNKVLKARYPYIKLVGADAVHHAWAIATEMTKNAELKQAVDIVGEHSACGWRTPYTSCKTPADARSLGKPLWNSEHSSMGHDVGAKPMARALNRLYIDGRITGNLSWSLISAWYANFPIGDTGLMLAEWPWSGFYRIGKSIWAHAHTTQFAQPGWQYIDGACGYLGSGASYVTLKSPGNKDYTVVIEAIDAKEAQNVSFTVEGGLPVTKNVQLWSTNLESGNAEEQFIHIGEIKPENGKYSIQVKPGYVYTLSTTTGQKKGTGKPAATVAEQMSLPFSEDFESYGQGKLARYFSDINGGFETAACTGGRNGLCYRQTVTSQPISWWHGGMRPATIMGDPRWWGDYEVSADVLLEQPGYVELLGRVSAQAGTSIVGYHLQVNNQGVWKLYSQDFSKTSQVMLSDGGEFARDIKVLDSGKVAFKTEEWHKLALRMRGEKIDILIDNKQVGSVKDSYHTSGQIGLLVSPWQNAQFDNVKIIPTNEWPRFVPQKNIRITATSEHAAFTRGYDYVATNAIDGRPETSWHSEWEPKTNLPQAITLDMGSSYKVKALVYQPRLVSDIKGLITGYSVYTSADGRNFKKVASGQWPKSSTTKIVKWYDSQQARYVRLEVTEGSGNLAAIGEISLIME